MIRIRQLLTVVLAAISLVALAACGSGGGGGGGGGKAGPVEVVTHNAVGGGSDVFTRQMIKVMYENKIIDTNWPVRNVPAGDSIGAMSYMVDRKGNAGLIAQVTPTWLATPMTVANAKVSLADLTPITLVATEPQVIVTNAKSPFNSFADFVNAAKAQPDTLVQAGGSSTANDALTRLVLQDTLGAKWKFLSFEDTGSRITALLRNDANIMLGSASDVAEQVKAGQLKVCGLPVSVFRSGMILADRRYDGQLNVSDMFTRLIYSIVVTGLAPQSFYQRTASGERPRSHYDGLPVDFVAESITTLGAGARRGFRSYDVMNPHDDGISLDVFVDWLIESGLSINRVDDYGDWLNRLGTALRSLPDAQRQHSVLPLLTAYSRPEHPLLGSLAPAEAFRKAVQQNKIGAEHDIPHLSRQLIEKYVSGLRGQGLLPN